MGRDAADVALTTSFGFLPLTKFAVVTDEEPAFAGKPVAVELTTTVAIPVNCGVRKCASIF